MDATNSWCFFWGMSRDSWMKLGNTSHLNGESLYVKVSDGPVGRVGKEKSGVWDWGCSSLCQESVTS